MHNLTVPRQDLGRPDPLALSKIRRNREVLVGIVTWRHREVLANVDDNVRLAKFPAFHECRLRRQVPRISLRGSSVHPGLDRGNLLVRKSWIVGEGTELRIGKP